MSEPVIEELLEGSGAPVDEVELQRSLSAVSDRILGGTRKRPTVGRFTLLGRVGSGGMGVVYAAFDPKLDRRIALKLLHTSGLGERANARLLGEARNLARVAHPNVVPVFEVGTFEGRVFVAMELIDGVPWSTWITARQPWREVIDVAVQAGRGVMAAHSRGIVHRDFKPANVMVGEDGRVVVLDFGLAQSFETMAEGTLPSLDNMRLTQLSEGSVTAGTPAYMAPESIDGHPASQASDQFSFCVSVYEVLFGVRPFGGETVYAQLDAMERGARPPDSGTGDVPTRVVRVLLRGLERDPGKRWPSLDALLRALEDAVRPRRVWPLAVPVLALMAVSTALALKTDEDPCVAGAADIESVWTGTRADALARSPSASAQQVSAIEDALDDYVQRWRQTYLVACRKAQPTDGATSGEATFQCLGGQREWLLRALDALSDADAETWRNAESLLPNRRDLQRCEEAVLQPAAVERAPLANSEARAAFEGLLVEMRVHAGRGDIDHVLKTATDADRQAHSLDDDSLRARALLARGSAMSMLDRDQQAVDALQNAVVAAERSGSVSVRLAAIRLLALRQVELGRLEDAEHGVRTVLAAHERFPSRPWTWDAELMALQATLARERGDKDEAVRRARAREAFILHHATDDPRARIDARSFHIEMRLHNGETEGMLDVIENLRRDATEHDGAASRRVAKIWGFVFNVRYQQGDLEEARTAILKSLEQLSFLDGEDATSVLPALNNAAVIEARLGDLDAAFGMFSRLASIARAHRPTFDRRLATALHNLALVWEKRGEPEKTLAGLEEARSVYCDLYGCEHPKAMALVPDIAAALTALGKQDDALELLREGIETETRAHGSSAALFALRLTTSTLLQNKGAREEATEQAESALSYARANPSTLRAKQRHAVRYRLVRLLLEHPSAETDYDPIGLLDEAEAELSLEYLRPEHQANFATTRERALARWPEDR
ncbi:MAG: protein kinase [Nannocystaceae bacterium]|nr:protein kinase [Nannocystaceae bacterium]